MKRYLFVGDVHADADFLEEAFAYARENDAHDVVQVGDFGMIWRSNATLDYVSTLARCYDVTLRWIDGNHENHVRIRELCEMHSMAGMTLPGGGYEFSPNVIYQPRGSTHVDEDGTRFLFCGGAPSIDWFGRVEGVSIWADLEHVSEDEHDDAMNHCERIDVLVTHDAPSFPPGFGPKGDPDFRERAARSMEMVAELIDHHRPDLHVHGHWHQRATRVRGVTRVEGLDCNYARFADAVMLWSRDEETT